MPRIFIAATGAALVDRRSPMAVIEEKVEKLGAGMVIAERRCRRKENSLERISSLSRSS